MRTITAAQSAVLDAEGQANFARLSVKDLDGNWRDLTTYPGFNAVKQLSWKANINDPHMTFDAVLAREVYQLSLSPFMEDSALNRGFDPDEVYEPLLALNREAKIEVAVVPMDTEPESGDWMTVFHGRIDELDAARGKDISISGRDLGGRLAQQYIKTERVYAFAADGAMVSLRIWQPEMVISTVAPNDYVLPYSRGADDTGYNRFFQATVNGIAGTTEPDWSTSTVTDGTGEWGITGAPTLSGFPLEEVIQKILDDNVLSGDVPITLYTPTSPLWDVTEFMQQRGFTLDAIRALASQIGWDIRYKWRAAASEFQLTLYEPDRTSPSVDRTFSPAEYGEPSKMALNIAQIRNSVRIIYKDSADRHPDGTAKRKEVTATDSISIDAYGELWSEIQEDENGNIDTEAEADRLAEAFISDCARPTAEVAIPLMRGFPWVELNDYYTFEADDVHSSESMSLAVTGWTQDFQDGELTTRLELRGLPTAGHQVHIDKEHHPSKPPKNTPHRLVHFDAPTTANPVINAIVGGVRVFMDAPDKNNGSLQAEYEVHIVTSPGDTLDDTTLVAITQGNEAEVADLTPGQDYYVRTVPRYFNAGQLVRGQPSKAHSFTAGRASSGHVKGGIAIGDYPLNGGFETRIDTGGLPDHWTLYSGAYSTNVQVMEDGNGVSGTRYVRLKSGGVRSAVYPMLQEANASSRRGSIYRFHWWRKSGSDVQASTTYSALIRLLDYQENEVTILTVSSTIPADNKLGQWVREELFVRLKEGDASARSLQLILSGGSTTTNRHIDIDEVRCQYLGTAWYEVGDTTYYTENYEAIPAFGTGWSSYGSGNEDCAFRKDHTGRVWLKGLATSADDTLGTGNLICTLPAGFRPAELIHIATCADNRYATLEINTSGQVYISAADSATWHNFVSIDCNFMTTAVSSTTT